MYRILKKRQLAESVFEYVFDAPYVAGRAKPGQFVILIVDEQGERVPFTICDYDREAGSVTILVQSVGFSTKCLSRLQEGDSVFAFVGPLGNPTDLNAYRRVCLIGGGIGAAVIYPQAKHLKSRGAEVDVILGARDASLIMYESEFRNHADHVYVMTDNGSAGEQGFVTNKLLQLLKSEHYDCVFAVGPMPMMKAVVNLTRPMGIPTVVSLNAIMVDGTGMCGCCRVKVGGATRYACVDGPEFDGFEVDFDEAINRLNMYKSINEENTHKCKIR